MDVLVIDGNSLYIRRSFKLEKRFDFVGCCHGDTTGTLQYSLLVVSVTGRVLLISHVQKIVSSFHQVVVQLLFCPISSGKPSIPVLDLYGFFFFGVST